MADPKRPEDQPKDPIEELIGTHDPEDDGDPAENIEEEGEPFDGNFA